MPAWLKPILEKHFTDEAGKAALEKAYAEIDKATDAEIGKGFVARDDFNAANTAKKTAETTVKTLEGQLEELKKANPEELKKTIEGMQQQNATLKAGHEAEIQKVKMDAKIEIGLIQAGAVNVKAVRAAVLDESKLSLDTNGNLLGFEEQITAAKADPNNKWAFGTVAPARSGAAQGTPPGAGGEKTLADEIKEAMYGAPAQ